MSPKRLYEIEVYAEQIFHSFTIQSFNPTVDIFSLKGISALTAE